MKGLDTAHGNIINRARIMRLGRTEEPSSVKGQRNKVGRLGRVGKGRGNVGKESAAAAVGEKDSEVPEMIWWRVALS